jgi:F-type H+-transporting ATPase subunit alpha
MILSKDLQDVFAKELEQELQNLLVENIKTPNNNKKEGLVVSFRDGVGVIDGLEEAKIGQKLLFQESTKRAKDNGEDIEPIFGQIFDIDEHSINCIVFGEERFVKQGDKAVLDTNDLLLTVSIQPENIFGSVIDPFGRFKSKPDTYKENTNHKTVELNIEADAAKLIHRAPINKPMFTGIKAIDSMFPIGHGQRMLLIGDRGTGKSQICIDTICHHSKYLKDDNSIFIYVAIGKRKSEIAKIVQTLKKNNAFDRTIIVSTDANDPAALLYVAPFAGCAIGEYYRDLGKNVVIFYDDLSKHANAYRHISLLLERTPGREAYPGDIFYLHSRLLERSASVYLNELEINPNGTFKHTNKHCKTKKEGTLTALPIIETKENDYAAYVPTNVISITDGQIYFDKGLFNEEILPAINTGLSVSRVGGDAQSKAMKTVSKFLKPDLAAYRDKKKYESFGFEMSAKDKVFLNHGSELIKIMKQKALDTCNERELVTNIISTYLEKEKQLTDEDDKIFNKLIRDSKNNLASFVNQGK